MRTGTRTVDVPLDMTSAPATTSGRCARTASRTFSLCRNQSRAPREKRSYQALTLSPFDDSATLPPAHSCASSVVT